MSSKSVMIPRELVTHLIAAAEYEMARIIAISESLGDDDDWPPDFDPNDYGLFQIAIDGLKDDPPECGGKALHFLADAVPTYVSRTDLSRDDRMALRQFWKQHGLTRWFPD